MERFMELALYEDGEGYYSASAAAIGARGDFSTSATLSPLLARALLARWEEACTRFGRRLPLLEVGGGDGSLASAIGRELGFLQRLRTRYLMVDRSRVLRGVQRLCAGNFARVYSTMDAALKRAGGAAFIFSNELPDAFPARRFLFRGGEWLELGVSFENASCAETPRPCPSLPESSAFAFWRREGQIVEVHESYARWYRGWQPQWKEGGAHHDRLRRRGGESLSPPPARHDARLQGASPARARTGVPARGTLRHHLRRQFHRSSAPRAVLRRRPCRARPAARVSAAFCG